MQTSRSGIISFIAELSAIPFGDPLVDISSGKKAIKLDIEPDVSFELSHQADLDALLRVAAANKKDADLDTLCIASGIVNWTYKDKAIRTPLLLIPLLAKKHRSAATIKFEPQPELQFLNPFLKHTLLSEFSMDEEEHFAQSFGKFLEGLPGINLAEEKFIGNFHHHRYALLREMETLSQQENFSPLVETLLGDEAVETHAELELSEYFLTPSDPDQKKVFELLKNQNLVIQGPPGTGKSQVLTNLIGKRLPYDGTTLVVSEKKSALDVLVAKLKLSQLDHFAFLAHSQVKPKEFISALRSNWKSLEENDFPDSKDLHLSQQLHHKLQLLLDKLNSPGLVGGVCYTDFRNLQVSDNAAFSSSVPELSEWLKYENEVTSVQKLISPDGVFTRYKKALLTSESPDKTIQLLYSEAIFFQQELNIVTVYDLENLLKVCARIQLLENDSAKLWFGIYSNQNEVRRFTKLRQRFNILEEEIAAKRNEYANWQKIPSKSELQSWLHDFSGNLSWRLKRRSDKIKRTFLTGNLNLNSASQNLLSLLELEDELISLKTKFLKYGIENPETELSTVSYIIHRLSNEDPNELNSVFHLPEHQKRKIRENEERTRNFLSLLNRNCKLKSEDNLSRFFQTTENYSFVVFREELKTLPSDFYDVLGMVSSLQQANDLVIASNWQKTLALFPELRNYKPEKLKILLEEIIQFEDAEFVHFSNHIKFTRKQKFDHYARILRTASVKLSASDKELKKELKAGKALLVKEFAKSKQHLGIRRLFTSEARVWIELLTPVWLSTPSQMATFFPMEKDVFDLVIFDEASQISLPNALGSLQRSKRAVVAGDIQQMSPSSYFSGAKSSVDLLHQAGFYWKNTALKHHYRSVHPALIEFSNKHFYNDELLAFSSPKTVFPLHRHFVPDGVFSERANVIEAQRVAEFLEHADWKNIGITAFSGQQLEMIWNQCSERVKSKISEGIGNGSVFFKALESVQGDECDTLVISMGYAKNEDGYFHLRFGPLNQANGHKRLNVLLTRARKELHFFTSVTSDQIPLSRNESVNLLRSYLFSLEQGEVKEGIKESNSDKFTLQDAHSSIPYSDELSTYYRVMKNRGWKIAFT